MIQLIVGLSPMIALVSLQNASRTPPKIDVYDQCYRLIVKFDHISGNGSTLK